MHEADMNDYKKYGVEDLVWDTFFRQWVLTPTRESDRVWKQLQAENPEMTDNINKAREVVLSLRVTEPEISTAEISKLVKETISKTTPGGIIVMEPEAFRGIPFYKKFWFRIAASFTVVMFFAWLAKSRLPESNLANFGEKENLATDSGLLIEKINTTKATLLVSLEDGSKVTLAPESRIRYARKFVGGKREVYLAGEAFFDISKDPARPFFVYANELVTKVLGTSFTIKAYKTSKEVTVEVKTGRVSVFTQLDPDVEEKINNRELEGVVLSPNQKIIYARDQIRMVKTLVEKPEIIISKAKAPQFIFEDVPVSEVFDSIGKAYGIDILYDEELLKGCPLTAILENQTLHEKLTIICKAIEANYEILDGQIVVHGKGCKN
jgi:transmembrane sensor